MSTPKETIWQIEPHTQAKHVILRKYLGAWFPILNRRHGRIIYIDGFSGPGEYVGGEPGSPVIALDVALNHRRQMGGELVFQFVDEDEDRIVHLRELIAQREIPENFMIRANHGNFQTELTNILDGLEREGHQIAPTFAFIDPFGFSGVPMSLIHRLLSHRRTEAFITFPVGFINRFLEHPDPQIPTHVVEAFGTEEVLDIVNKEGDRTTNLRNLYQRRLLEVAKFVRFFQMRNRRNLPIYDLFFAGNHELGHCRMKEAMWAVDPDGDFVFSDATNPHQSVLFTIDNTPQLLDSICDQFAGRQEVQVSEIKQWVRNFTPFIDRHSGAALRLGEQTARIDVLPIKANGKRRIRGTFPDDVIVNFPAS